MEPRALCPLYAGRSARERPCRYFARNDLPTKRVPLPTYLPTYVPRIDTMVEQMFARDIWEKKSREAERSLGALVGTRTSYGLMRNPIRNDGDDGGR